jgi:putative salt-induced outer membrane protein YdiY
MKVISQKKFLLFLTLFLMQISVYAEHLDKGVPPAKKFDWMELDSGEWLKGRFEEIHKGNVIFDSEEMGVLIFDLGDVDQILTKGKTTVNIDDHDEPVIGKMVFKNEKFTIISDDGTVVNIKSTQIASAANGEDIESSYWSANILFGMDVMSGNTDQVTATVQAFVQRRSSDTRLRADYLGTYTRVDNNITAADSNRFSTFFDIYQTAHFFWRAGYGEFFRDPFQNIEQRYTVTAGVGYDILHMLNMNWSITVGPGYQRENYSSPVLNRAGDTNLSGLSTPVVYFNTSYNYDIAKDVDFLAIYSMYYQTKKSGTYIHHAIATLNTEFINDFIFNISFIWDRTATPQSFIDTSGLKQTPEKNDYKSVVSLGYSY